MEILRRSGYLEIRLPELFDLDPRVGDFGRIFSGVQPGNQNLLFDISGDKQRPRPRSHSEIVHVVRTMVEAFRNMKDSVELLAFLVRTDQIPHISPYVRLLENAGYTSRPFVDPMRARCWVGRG
jgi:hypothetical protein